jgi:hypothetical protein
MPRNHSSDVAPGPAETGDKALLHRIAADVVDYQITFRALRRELADLEDEGGE